MSKRSMRCLVIGEAAQLAVEFVFEALDPSIQLPNAPP